MSCREPILAAVLVAACGADEPGDMSEGSTGAEGEFAPAPEWEPLWIGFDDHAVPVADTTYVCRGVSIPMDRLRQVVAFEPMVDDRAVVHHMVLFRLPDPAPDTFECLDMPIGAVPQYGWAPGSGPLELPPEAGFMVGDDGPQAHFALQVHYDNPRLEPDHRDSSGVVAYLGAQLRPDNAGVLTLGTVAQIEIPPGEEAWELASVCDTRPFPEPIHVFGTVLHGHQILRQIWTEHRRGAERMGDVGRNDHFRFDIQRFDPLDVEVEPGDTLVTHCVWDSSARDTATVGGNGSSDEMCLNSLFYYPRLGNPYCGTG